MGMAATPRKVGVSVCGTFCLLVGSGKGEKCGVCLVGVDFEAPVLCPVGNFVDNFLETVGGCTSVLRNCPHGQIVCMEAVVHMLCDHVCDVVDVQQK